MGLPAKAYWQKACQRSAEKHHTFLFMVEQGMTRTHLAKLIARNPRLWSEYSVWLKKLPV